MRLLELSDFRWPPGKGGYLFVPEHKTKNGMSLDLELSPEAGRHVRCFIDQHRQLLPGSGGTYLFPGETGGPRSKNAIYEATCGAARKPAGLDINPHLFRHAIAKIAVERDPGAVLAVSRTFGHKSLDTTTSMYLGTEGRAAARHLDRILRGDTEA
jgi:integrase